MTTTGTTMMTKITKENDVKINLGKTPAWDTWGTTSRHVNHVRGFDVYDDSQDSLSGSGIPDVGIYERYEDQQAEYVRSIVDSSPGDFWDAGGAWDAPARWGTGRDSSDYDAFFEDDEEVEEVDFDEEFDL